MNKTEIIARRILGWKLNRWDRWYDFEKNVFIHDSEFQPEQNLDHAMIIVNRLEKFGIEYAPTGESEVCFKTFYNNVSATGENLAQAITNAAYALADNSQIAEEWL